MAIYHFSSKVLGKGKGRSAVQFSAYLSGSKMTNDRTAEHYDHSSKEEVFETNMVFTDDVPEDLKTPEKFWNAVEQNETQHNAQFARTFELALPNDASVFEMKMMAREFVDGLIKDGYCAVQYAIHLKDGNYHIHAMAPMRQMEKGEWERSKFQKGYVCFNQKGEEKIFLSVKDIPEGWARVPVLDDKGIQKSDSHNRLQWKRASLEPRTLDTKAILVEQRHRWADIQNQYLDEKEKVSALSYADQGIEKLPTKHMGYVATKMEKEGIKTEKGNYNRSVQKMNETMSFSFAELMMLINENKNKIIELTAQLQAYLAETMNSIVKTPLEPVDGQFKPVNAKFKAVNPFAVKWTEEEYQAFEDAVADEYDNIEETNDGETYDD